MVKIKFWRRGRKEPGLGEEVIAAIEKEPVVILPLKPEYEIIESYYVYEPYAKVNIVSIPEAGGALAYYVEEYRLSEDEKDTFEKLVDILVEELRPAESFEDLKKFVFSELRRIADRYRGKLNLVGGRRARVLYYVERNLLGYGPIDALMRDPYIEDISCDGVNKPVYVWHRRYENIPTNIIFKDMNYLNEFILKLAHMAGKHISLAYPVLDAMLPEKHRLAATFGTEVSPKGPTFTIRKFREKPFSITELIQYGVINDVAAGYIWLMLEHGRTLMIAGGTGAGKTTLLNAFSLFIKPGMKVVTVEDIPELNLPHENWVQLTIRPGYTVGTKAGEIELFDLVKLSLRYRPDYLIVGEVRGSEAFVLFQAMATGHGGLSTIHAETLDYAIKRLTSPPMNIPPTYMRLMNIFAHIQKVTTRAKSGAVRVTRRVTVIQEVADYDDYRLVVKWDPSNDSHEVYLDNSIMLKDISDKLAIPIEELKSEILRRAEVLRWLRLKGIFDVWEVSKYIFQYYYDPNGVYGQASKELAEVEAK
ncbi:MAG: type II/IV secretion system ATPase subunit [archaeon GB-1867-005]|nr:type II/IV secretion system ATPase subunit [Candidatus Culexmicrobium cathedralense]